MTRAAHTAIRAAYSVAEAPSQLRREGAELAVLERFGDRARIVELHGDLLFAGAESAVRAVEEFPGELDALVLDVREVGDVSAIAVRMLAELRTALAATGCRVALVDPGRHTRAVGIEPRSRRSARAGVHRPGQRRGMV